MNNREQPSNPDNLEVFPETWDVPYRSSPSFVGRRKELETIQATLMQHGIITIAGISGVGKTRLAVEYAYGNRRDYDAVLWIDDSEKNT